MMWGLALIFFSSVAARGTSYEIEMECREFPDFPPNSDISPSVLGDLKVKPATVGGRVMLNISWAVNIDASVANLTGTRITVNGENTHSSVANLTGTRITVNGENTHCEYKPPLAEADLSGSKQKWFHYLVKASYGSNVIQAANLPLPPLGSGKSYRFTRIRIPHPKPVDKPKTSQVPRVEITTLGLRKETVPSRRYVHVNYTNIAVAIFGGLAGLMILSSCYIIYKNRGANFASPLGFRKLPSSPMVPVPVLMVYLAENSAFQQAVVALAEFLQWHGGCSVAVDMWQQGKIAELGPMRWLAEQAKDADRVLIVCPQPSSQPSHNFPGPSIPAAAHDLYPLILNMVASHAKSTSDLDKFWVVQLGKQQDKRPSNLPLELRACKTFCLMKDTNKLCRSLHSHRQDHKRTSDLIFRPGIPYSEKSTVKLREFVEKLGGHQTNIFSEVEPLKSVVTTI